VGADPRTTEAKSDYYDSMFHAAAAVGINTSALIELAIVGRPAFTLLDPEFADTQAGTLHFAHLTQTAGGILTTASSMDEHHAQLNAALASGAVDRGEFLRAFVRPYGLDQRAAALMADGVEALAVAEPARVRGRTDAVILALVGPLRRFGAGGKRRGKRGRWDRFLRKTRLRKRARRWGRRLLRPWTLVRRG
jgi:hypothetical protein